MNWNWNPADWRRRTKVLLGLVTIWPPIYIALFVFIVFSFAMLMPLVSGRSGRSCGSLDALQLDRKIKNGEIEQLTVRPGEILARERGRDCQHEVSVTNQSTREELLKAARELDANGRPRVASVIEEDTDADLSPAIPIGFIGLFAAHMFTILLSFALMPLYIVLAVQDERHDQTMKIVWVVLICTMGIFANPVYWYLYVWRPPAVTMSNAESESSFTR